MDQFLKFSPQLAALDISRGHRVCDYIFYTSLIERLAFSSTRLFQTEGFPPLVVLAPLLTEPIVFEVCRNPGVLVIRLKIVLARVECAFLHQTALSDQIRLRLLRNREQVHICFCSNCLQKLKPN